MELSNRTFNRYMYAAAIEAPVPRAVQHSTAHRVAWEDTDMRQRWDIDGGEADGTQFFAVPRFARGKPPLRIDVHIPDSAQHPRDLQRVLDSNSCMLVDTDSVGSTPLCQHILHALEAWTDRFQGLEEAYMSMPFASRIIIHNIRADVRQMSVDMHADHSVEQRMLSIHTLQGLWKLPTTCWPRALDLGDLRLLRQPHPGISLVRLRGCGDRIFVFKSLPPDTGRFYHELRTLVTLPAHPNIIGAPLYLVTIRCRFGGKQGVCGFILHYYPTGSLKATLLARRTSGISLTTKLAWARQIGSALIHIQNSPLAFYTNLKLQNIVMVERHGALDACLIDFEQRLGPSSWSPPEVHYVSYLMHLATHSTNQETRRDTAELLKVYIPGWRPRDELTKYCNPQHGYCEPWPTLMANGQSESVQVYMFGKLLWCIFEDVPEFCAHASSRKVLQPEGHRQKPEFRNTPPELRDVIMQCTSGAMEWRGRYAGLTRTGRLIHPRGTNASTAGPQDVDRAAKRWWEEELSDAQRYVEACILSTTAGAEPWDENEVLVAIAQRPTLAEVQAAVERFRPEPEPLGT
ncbi:hypothetical protein LTR53_007706 [Teratosphaeriaceae sp. CCFEE 6253]|nr:hypothetical protein LTR53_007706 [Teratosphaeriaceae sp. CCFEE 6253]